MEAVLLRAISQPALSRPLGWLSDRRFPSPIVDAAVATFTRAFGVDLSEAAERSWPTFNAFFTRRLRDGARPVCREADVLTSPTDSRVDQIGPVPADGQLTQVKGKTYSVEELLGDPEPAALFRGGVAATLYLSPGMYHRVHSPVDGTVQAVRHLPGRLFPVNPLGTRRVDRLFAVNERVVVYLDSSLGPVALVMVGATVVGRIALAFTELVSSRRRHRRQHLRFPDPPRIRRGEEIGAFHLGSTVVLLAADPHLRSAGPDHGDLVRMGEPLLRRAPRG